MELPIQSNGVYIRTVFWERERLRIIELLSPADGKGSLYIQLVTVIAGARICLKMHVRVDYLLFKKILRKNRRIKTTLIKHNFINLACYYIKMPTALNNKSLIANHQRHFWHTPTIRSNLRWNKAELTSTANSTRVASRANILLCC